MIANNFLKEKGQEIKRRRKALKLTQEFCAKEIGVTQGIWSRYEAGTVKGAPAEIFDKIEELLGMKKNKRFQARSARLNAQKPFSERL